MNYPVTTCNKEIIRPTSIAAAPLCRAFAFWMSCCFASVHIYISIRSLRLRFRTVTIAVGLVHSLGWQCNIVCMRIRTFFAVQLQCMYVPVSRVYSTAWQRHPASAQRLCSCR